MLIMAVMGRVHRQMDLLQSAQPGEPWETCLRKHQRDRFLFPIDTVQGKERECYRCHRRGHLRKDCRAKRTLEGKEIVDKPRGEVSRSQGKREWSEEEALLHVPETGPPGQGVLQSQAADQCTR